MRETSTTAAPTTATTHSHVGTLSSLVPARPRLSTSPEDRAQKEQGKRAQRAAGGERQKGRRKERERAKNSRRERAEGGKYP
eukprot:516428-Rhodomonas_salina.1